MAQKEQRFPVVLHRGDNGVRHNHIVAVPVENRIAWLSHGSHRRTLDHRFVLEKERKRETILACILRFLCGRSRSSHKAVSSVTIC